MFLFACGLCPTRRGRLLLTPQPSQTLANILSLRRRGVLARDHVEGVVQAHRIVSVDELRDYCQANDLAPADLGGLEDVIRASSTNGSILSRSRAWGPWVP